MSMLAAPRRKQKVINLRAKNNAWSNDSNKFGQRMLEKMGWSSGKGLGAKETGMVDHVVARYKHDEKGLGYEDKNDQWTKHEDDFNALLANLSNGDVKEEKLHSGVSLEDKSKKSKARVHYHKFTRGKDLTKYSEKDLANIFGKKSLKNEEKTLEESAKEIETKEKIFTEKGSMEDYFKSKMAALKAKKNVSIINNNSNDNADVDYAFKGFAGTTNCSENQEEIDSNFSSFQQAKPNIENEISEENIDCHNINKKKKKKKSKCQDNCTENFNSITTDKQNIQEVQDEVRKNKNKIELENIFANVENTKKSKKKKAAEMETGDQYIYVSGNAQDESDDYHVPKKKKKRKNKDV